MNGRMSSFLNASRWMAAFAVLIMHVRHFTLADYRQVISPGILSELLYFVTGLGHEAVMVFFVVSGYLVGGLTVIRYKQRGFDLLDYTIHRTSRIYIVLVPALVLGGMTDIIGFRFFNNSSIYSGQTRYHIASLYFVIADNLNVQTFLANLVMLENIWTRQLGSNGPLWSLLFEWWYYCIFAAAMVLFARGSSARKIIGGVALAALCIGLPHVLLLWGVMWLVGLGAAIYGESRFWKPPVWLGLIVFVGAVAVSRVSQSSESGVPGQDLMSFRRDLGVAVTYAFLMLAFRREGKPIPMARMHARLADFSYTLYLFHFPALVLCIAALHDILGISPLQQPGFAGISYFIVLVAFLFGYAWFVAIFTEGLTDQIRSALSGFARRLTERTRISQPAG